MEWGGSRSFPGLYSNPPPPVPRSKPRSALREQFEAAMAAGELLEMLESLPRGAVEASVRLMRGYNRTGEWPEPTLTSPAPQRGRSPSPVDEWSDG